MFYVEMKKWPVALFLYLFFMYSCYKIVSLVDKASQICFNLTLPHCFMVEYVHFLASTPLPPNGGVFIAAHSPGSICDL
jgi:hypothetical protein